MKMSSSVGPDSSRATTTLCTSQILVTEAMMSPHLVLRDPTWLFVPYPHLVITTPCCAEQQQPVLLGAVLELSNKPNTYKTLNKPTRWTNQG